MCHRGEFTTRSGRTVPLEIWVEPANLDKCDHALQSLQKAMKWDEDVYGLEIDLDLYMIFVADDFNMGAMENKGLNIFNSKYVLQQHCVQFILARALAGGQDDDGRGTYRGRDGGGHGWRGPPGFGRSLLKGAVCKGRGPRSQPKRGQGLPSSGLLPGGRPA